MNAWAFGTLTLITFICVCGILANNLLDRWFRLRFDDAIERQRPRPRHRIIDVDVGSGGMGLPPRSHVDGQPRRPNGIPMSTAKCAANKARPR